MSLPPLASIFRTMQPSTQDREPTQPSAPSQSPFSGTPTAEMLQLMTRTSHLINLNLSQLGSAIPDVTYLERLALDTHQLFALSTELLERAATCNQQQPQVRLLIDQKSLIMCPFTLVTNFAIYPELFRLPSTGLEGTTRRAQEQKN